MKIWTKRQHICFLMAVLWMILIFSFSAKEADASAKDSQTVGLWIGRLVISDFETWDAQKQEDFAEAIEYPIRKGAHATEYAILGMLLFGWILKEGRRHCLLLSWSIGTVYAATDEIHQLFVPGRSGQISDVCLDSAGVLLGVLLLWLLWGRFFCLKERPLS